MVHDYFLRIFVHYHLGKQETVVAVYDICNGQCDKLVINNNHIINIYPSYYKYCNYHDYYN